MDTKKITSRNNSICETPQELLLKAVKDNNIQKIKTLIKENPSLLSVEYPYPHYGKIIYVACAEQMVSANTLEVLIELGAKPFEETVGKGELIHVLAELSDSAKLKVLVGYLTPETINRTYDGNDALLVLIKQGKKSRRKEILECARILINSGINVNHPDFKNLTAVLWAIKKEYRDVIEILLENSLDLNIDNYIMNGMTARQLLMSKYSNELVLPNKTILSPKELLFNYIKSYNEDAFVVYNEGDISLYKDSDNSSHTLLQLSCQLGLVKATRHLLENKADVRKTIKNETRTPLELAGENGYFEIVELLLEYDKTLKVPSSILSSLLNKMNLSQFGDNYEKCFEQLLQTQDEISLNSPDSNFQQTPLHFAVKFAKPKHILQLLSKGSSLANKNEFGIMAIENIEAEVLEQHLDDCVDINDIDKNNVYVTLKYNTLVPFPVTNPSLESSSQYCEEGKQILSQNFKPETDALLYISKAPYLKHLLTHPVLDTFLLLKWHKINMIFYTNLFFYFFFITSLLTYILSSYGNFHYISDNDSSLLAIASVSHFILCLTYVILVMREGFQILVNPMEYYKDVDNWIEIILIFIVGFIIFSSDPTNDSRKQLSSLAILLSTFELILMVGQHPRLTTNVVMFKRVSANFIKFLAWYFLLIAAFAMSFFILFSESVEKEQGGKIENEGEKEEENNFFINPGVALFKTLVMLTGEFDASDMNFHSFPITSKVIFLMFVLMIALILLNLLNGLAVSDTQSIKNDAECVGLMARTEHIHYMESMVFGNILPSTILNFLNKICCCFPFERNLRFIISQPLLKHISLYPKTEITIPMSNDFEMMKVDKKGSKRLSALSVFNSLKLDKKIQRKIRKVMQNQRITNNEVYIKNKIKQIENEQSEILSILQDIKTKLYENRN